MICRAHDFSGLYTHFGPYGRQDVHYHICFTDGCDRVLIGTGRDCDGLASHHRETLTAKPVERSND